ncbi:glycoside hydrolase family 16 protein [Kribbella qitaiheensis]|uniref:Glycoside hydrolase family 16 protein n=1 Tax=Kribbella qitaiheensis TaxID=1544730 RepID=A0A7G6X2C8_9ACTN|nr:glycoside hydrolase family 16 protein [Kribbella qitaiheensis]QNE20393.1 glycoside hydrolase family 16 protein [Kribbella qitaiheensis]
MRDAFSRRHAQHRAAVPSDKLKEPAAKAGRRTLIPIIAGTSLLLTTAGIGVAALNSDSIPAPVSLTATADAYVQTTSATQRHGWSSRLVAKMNESTSFIRYSVPAVADGYDRKATLVLTRLTTSNPAKIAVSKAPGSWTEAVTYSTAPKPGTPFVTVADDGKSAQLRIDVSEGITEAGELNLAVTQPVGAGGTIFGSREAGTMQTKLEISYVPEGTTGPVPSTPTSAPTSAPTTVQPTQSPTATPTTTKPTTTPTTASPTPTATASPTTTSPTSTPPTTGLAPSWNPANSSRLTFQDEFNASAVDTTKWERGWFKEGISDGVNSDNLQCYDTRQVSEAGGFLNLSLAQQQATCRGGTKQYVSGLVNTRKTFNQRYGSFEARVCLPDGNGDGRVDGFPAWWTNGPSSVPWPDHGEIDVLEGIGGGTKASLHYVDPVYHGGTYSSTPLAGCHNFGSQWTSSGVTFYYDGKPMWSHAFAGSLPQFLIFNYAVRQHSGEAITPGTAVRVDWVRVWA